MADEARSAGRARRAVVEEFTRAAAGFDRRTQGRFDDLGVVELAGVDSADTILEVGAGTGAFLSLFEGVGARLIALDLTPAMLAIARSRGPRLHAIVGDGDSLPFRSSSIDLTMSAQVLHHVHEPVRLLREMNRVTRPGGRVLIVDQVAPDNVEQCLAMTHLETLRDPTHAASRPRAAFRIILQSAGLRILREEIVAEQQRVSSWMGADEFPAERIKAVRRWLDAHALQTGMGFSRDGDDWVFERRRIMLLATKERAG